MTEIEYKRVKLADEDADNPIVDQLEENGVTGIKGASKVAMDTRHRIWSEFAIRANELYYLSTIDYLKPGEDSRECGLCGHSIRELYKIERRSGKSSMVTRHADLGDSGVEIVWPNKFTVGNECIKMLGIDSSVSRFFRTYLNRRAPLMLRESDSYADQIKIGDLLRLHENWCYDRVVVPLYAFTRLDKEFEEYFGIFPTVKFQKPMVTFRRNSAKMMLKRKSRIIDPSAICLYGDEYLAYSITRAQAKEIMEGWKKFVESTKESA